MPHQLKRSKSYLKLKAANTSSRSNALSYMRQAKMNFGEMSKHIAKHGIPPGPHGCEPGMVYHPHTKRCHFA